MGYASSQMTRRLGSDICIKQVLLGDTASLAVAEAVGQVRRGVYVIPAWF
jgi:hypothetical protein